ncbi:MAG TPA: potassium transporter TrkG [Thermohalobaculum sp.]|nr:potassium transporter TrkG [Thermohalobaculum sp.]
MPLFPLCLVALSAGMVIPAVYALIDHDWRSARGFLYCAIFTGFAAAALSVVMATHRRTGAARGELLEFLVCWLLVPAFAAAPLWLRTPFVGPGGAWFEMISAFTTTGGTIYEEPGKVPGALHLWRGMVAWFGGLFTLIAAFAILAPRNLGGFEVTASGAAGAGAPVLFAEGSVARLSVRLARALRTVLPVYSVMTAVLAFLFSALGQDGLSAAVHAMAIVSTSGISPHGHGLAEVSSIPAEAVAALFMVAAATRLTYARGRWLREPLRWLRDPELRLMAVLVATATLALFLRHWFGVLTIDLGDRVSSALPALWGAIFTGISFLTTTGFESASWHTARDWSGLDNPGLILLGLCAIGGGAATTAGGIKLIRAYALLRHGYRELERISQPNSAMGTGARLRGILREGAFLAWAFIMLYSAAVFLSMIALTVSGLAFEHALVGALSSISNTGPAFALVTPDQIDFTRLSESQRAILGLTMIVGRIEVLAVISLFNPDSWSGLRLGAKNAGNALHKASQSKW